MIYKCKNCEKNFAKKTSGYVVPTYCSNSCRIKSTGFTVNKSSIKKIDKRILRGDN